MPRIEGAYPIAGEDMNALPVREIGAAVEFYENILGFAVERREPASAVVSRDGVRLGLIRQEDHRPEEAGSLAFAVDDLDAMHRELHARGGNPFPPGFSEWSGRRFRTFFVREDTNGYCYCFHHPAPPEAK